MISEMSRKKKIYNLSDLHNEARIRGGRCLNSDYEGVSAVYKWECAEGHGWDATFGNILYNKTWCRVCHVNERYGYSYEKLLKIAERHEVKLIEKEYVGIEHEYEWLCQKQHLTKMNLRDFAIKGCEECKRPQKLSMEVVEKRVEEIGMRLMNEKFGGITKVYSWKCNSCGTIKKTTFKNVYYSNKGCLECKRRNEETKKKEELTLMAEKKGYNVIQFFGEFPNIECILRCSKGHIRRGNYNMLKTKSKCAECANEKRQKYGIEDAKKIAEERGGQLLSDVFSTKNMEWRCKCGEQWSATFYNIKNGTWCPECSKGKGKRGRPKKH